MNTMRTALFVLTRAEQQHCKTSSCIDMIESEINARRRLTTSVTFTSSGRVGKLGYAWPLATVIH